MSNMHKVNSILYVEDEKLVQEELASFLKNFCETLYTADNGKEALEIYNSNSIDIIISDIKMPIMDGFEMAKKIKSINENQAIIFTTAFNEISYLKESIELQVSGYVLKPIDLEVLEKKINDIIITILWKEIDKEQSIEFEKIVDISKDGIVLYDLKTNILFCNKSFADMLGYTQEELYNINSIALGVKEYQEKSYSVLEEIIQNGQYDNYEKKYVAKDGSYVDVSMNLTLMPDKQRILGSIRDITEIKEKNRLLKEYVSIIDENVLTSSSDLKGKITKVSNAFCELSGYSKEELIGSNHNIIRHPEMPKELYTELWETIQSGKTWKGEIKNKKKSGEAYWVESTISPIFDQFGEKVGYTAIRHDITDKKRIEEISITDGLTSLYNRRYFDEVFPKTLNIAKRNKDYFAFVLMDIDHFKQYNDTYGHQKGDEVLKSVASCLKDDLKRANDHIFRLGGEEFGVIFEVDMKEKAVLHANTIKKDIEDLKIKHEKNSASEFVTVSIGLICDKAENLPSFDKVYRDADELLYKSKENGRNQVTTTQD